MRPSNAFGRVLSRVVPAVLISFAGACGGSTEPPDAIEPGEVDGLWDATLDYAALTSGGTLPCSATWVMAIQQGYTMVPWTARVTCGGSASNGQWEYRTYTLTVQQDGPEVVFYGIRGDTFAVATLQGSAMTGEVHPSVYQSAILRATRRSGPDPNLAPAILELNLAFPDVEIGGRLEVAAYVANAYAQPIDTADVAFTSSVPAFATLDAAGPVHGPGTGQTTILLEGVSPGTTKVVARIAELRDTATVVVLPPAASVEITQAPESLIVPSAYAMAAVAKDAAGEPMYDRRLTWETSNSSVATVDESGQVTAVAPGMVTVTARSTVVSASRTITVLPGAARMSSRRSRWASHDLRRAGP
jgi:hypothetical protein